ncbi:MULTISPECIES: SDR family oxidoreductase [unclassified Asaia]|uniref:SDR family oxidoreductase n=1 Tax=unclassified Asaia TaxID=2685023 RepID=UPI001F19AA73|nr:SDR family NAD(P)-dependent oxidoreductase [Asaia sp. W19]
MTTAPLSAPPPPHLLLVGASRGLGLALAEAFLMRGWRVTATRRGTPEDGLAELATRFPDRLTTERLDIACDAQIAALRQTLSGERFEMLFINAGTTNAQPDQPIGQVSASDFMEIMLTNALAPMRVIETLDCLVSPQGLIGVMSSGQGSVANNNGGQRELYRGSKAALNQFMRCYDARIGRSRPLALIAPGWVRTSLGGAQARFSIEETIPGVVDVLIAHRTEKGLVYRDYAGKDVPW